MHSSNYTILRRSLNILYLHPMKKIKTFTIGLLALLIYCCGIVSAQDLDRKIEFPNIDNYLTLKCDLHIHTVFSDGLVWPSIRVDEAVRDGLDAISLTEHLEYQPRKDDIPHPDRNRSYHIAVKEAKPHDLLIIHGVEITLKMPPGHANALFVNDANTIKDDDVLTAYRNARAQGAFIYWNHPHWVNQQKDGIPVISKLHQQLIDEDLLHGIEVVNDVTISEDALEIAYTNNLTALGTSDIHGLIDYQFDIASGGHRPISLVFAKERTIESIKEALFAGRTVAWFEDVLIGKEEWVEKIVSSSLTFSSKGYIGDSDIFQVAVSNSSDARFYLKNTSAYSFHKSTDLIIVEPQSEVWLQVLVKKAPSTETPLTFDVLNTTIGAKKSLQLEVDLSFK